MHGFLHVTENEVSSSVIQINMSHNSELDGYDSFEMKKALTGFQMNYKVKVEPLLLKIPFARQYGSEEVINSDVWNVISGDMIRKY